MALSNGKTRAATPQQQRSLAFPILFLCCLSVMPVFYFSTRLPGQVSIEAAETTTSTTPSFVWSTIPKTKRGYGVVYSAYSFDTKKSLPRFLREAATSAAKLKRNNPGVPVAIITNAAAVPDVFDHVIAVPDSMLFTTQTTRADGVHRQWFTRLFYLAHSPFEITWYVDSHADFATTQLQQGLQQFKRATHIDIATANAQPNGFFCHNFSLLFRWNDRVRTLFVDWMLRQLQRGLTADDQGTLCHAMACAGQAYGLRYGAIAPPWALAWLSLQWGPDNNQYWKHRTTRVISGPPHICHSADVCEIAATQQPKAAQPRVLYVDASVGKSSARVFYSQRELDASGVLPYAYTWRDWTKPQTEIVVPKKLKCPEASSSSILKSPPADKSNLPSKQKLPSQTATPEQACRDSLVTKPQRNAYGAWTFCESVLSKKPAIISFGIGTNMDWERSMITDYNATVYAHDPTPKAIQYVQSQQQKYPFLTEKTKFVFEPVGLGTTDQENVTLYLPSNPNFVSARVGADLKETGSAGSVQVRLVSMPTTLQMHNLSGVDIVKWDVEGIEFDVLNALFADSSSPGIPTKLLLLEWHGRFQKDLSQQKTTEKLVKAGFVKVHTSDNKEEEVFFNTRFADVAP